MLCIGSPLRDRGESNATEGEMLRGALRAMVFKDALVVGWLHDGVLRLIFYVLRWTEECPAAYRPPII